MTRPALYLFCTATWLGFAGGVSAQEEPVVLAPGGTQLFRALLDFAKVKPAARPDDYRNKIVVVYGRPMTRAQAATVQTATRNALVRGGAVLFLSDRGLDLAEGHDPAAGYYLPNDAADAFVIDARVSHPTKNFQNHPDCPFVSPGPAFDLAGAALVTAASNPFSGLNNVATNNPATLFLDNRARNVTKFAVYYEGTEVRHQERPNVAARYHTVFAIGQNLPYPSPSRWAAIADEDVLSNALLAARGTDNFVLAIQLIAWLRADGDRTECLFFEYGRRVDRFDEVKFETLPDLPTPVPPIPPLDVISRQLTDFGNRLTDEMQTQDRLHSNLVGTGSGYARWLRVLALIAGGMSLIYLIRQAFASRLPAPGPPVNAYDDGPPGKLLAVLRQEMVRGNNFTAAVSAYIEETFRLAGLPEGPHAAMPPVAFTGKAVKKRELMADILLVWKAWQTPPDQPIHYAVWRGVEPALDRIRRQAVKGRWHFDPTFYPPGGAA